VLVLYNFLIVAAILPLLPDRWGGKTACGNYGECENYLHSLRSWNFHQRVSVSSALVRKVYGNNEAAEVLKRNAEHFLFLFCQYKKRRSTFDYPVELNLQRFNLSVNPLNAILRGYIGYMRKEQAFGKSVLVFETNQNDYNITLKYL